MFVNGYNSVWYEKIMWRGTICSSLFIWKKVLYKLKTRIRLLAIKNNFSMNKMFIYLLELGYRFYVERYEKDYKFKMEGGKILW